MPGTIVLLGEWNQNAQGDYLAGPSGAIYECWPDGRKRAIRELPDGDYKLIAGMNPYDLV